MKSDILELEKKISIAMKDDTSSEMLDALAKEFISAICNSGENENERVFNRGIVLIALHKNTLPNTLDFIAKNCKASIYVDKRIDNVKCWECESYYYVRIYRIIINNTDVLASTLVYMLKATNGNTSICYEVKKVLRRFSSEDQETISRIISDYAEKRLEMKTIDTRDARHHSCVG